MGDFETYRWGCYNAIRMSNEIAPLSIDRVRQCLKSQSLGHRIVYHERTGSTNDIAKQLADAGELEGTVVIADEQLEGRGRFGRHWVAPAGSSLLFSVILRPRMAPSQVSRVTMALGLGACHGIETETGLAPRLKWPNDLLLNGKKCAGILSEANTTGGATDYLVCGLGLNVNFSAATGGIPKNATTIADELGRFVDRERLLCAILAAFEAYYVRLERGESLRQEWAQRLATLNKAIRAQTPWGEETGIAEDVDDDGALLLRRSDRALVRLVSADVTLLKE